MEGVVIKSTGNIITVFSGGENFLCRVKGNFRIRDTDATNPVSVGDKVRFETKANDHTITELLPRKNYIIRKSKKLSRQVQILASNLDHAYLIATPLLPRTSTGFIDRFLATAEAYAIPASVVFTKKDLYDKSIHEYVESLCDIYQGAGYTTHIVSARIPESLELFAGLLKDKINLFSGHSGVGKSSLINALIPGLNLKTEEISLQHSTGKHTTTFAEMHTLPRGGFIIDTPGIREFGVIEFDKYQVSHYFPEFFKLLKHCKYNNCMHVNESGCAVLEALNKGEVSESRYHNYISILNNEDIFN